VFNPTWFYVGVVYAAAVALARRAGVELPKRVAAFFYALVFVFMYQPLTQDVVNLPVDFLKTLPPWAYVSDAKAVNPQMNDIALQIVPWAHQVRESWKSLTPPLWNHYSATGYPLLASAQSSALSPLRILGLPLSLGHAMTFEAAMKILIALTFMFLWCRRRGYSELASATGAVAFAFSTFLIVWLHFPIATTACLVPAVFYFIDLLAERITYPRFVGAAIVWTCMLFGGHPETVSHTFFMAALYVGWVVVVERRVGSRRSAVGSGEDDGVARSPLLVAAPDDELRGHRQQATSNIAIATTDETRADSAASTADRRPPTADSTKRPPTADSFLATLTLAIAVAGLLATPLLGPFAEAVTKSKRYQDLKANPIEAEVPFSDWASAKLLVQPQFFGELPYEGWGPAHAESISGFAGTLGLAAWFALLAHVIRRRAWRSPEAFFVIATLFVVAIILSWPGVREVFHLFFQLAANARMRLFLVLLLAVQSAAAIDLLRRDRKSLLIGVGCAGALMILTYATTHLEVAYHDEVALQSLLPGFGILLLAMIAALVYRRHVPALLLLAAVTGELFETGRDWNPIVSNEWMYPKTPLLRALDEAAAETKEPFRIVANGPAFFPNVSAVYGYEDIRAHDPMANGRYIGLLSLIIDYDAANYFAEWNEWERRLVDYLNVRYVLTTPGGTLPPRFMLRYEGPDGRLFENTEVLPRFFAARNVILEFRDEPFFRQLKQTEGWAHTAFLENLTIEAEPQRDDFFKPRPEDAPMATTAIRSATPTDYHLHIKAPRWTLIVSSVPWWPGWKVERNGARIEPVRVNGGFLGFSVPPGELDVRVWYDPWSFRLSAIVALVTLAALVAYGLRRR
jgi:hypothetical protein